MVEIKCITTTCCPICGSSTIIEENIETEFNSEKIREHCNGGRWESRRFACGYRVSFCPNYLKEKKGYNCRNDLEIKRRDAIRRKCLEETIDSINKLDCDEEYKERLLSIYSSI